MPSAIRQPGSCDDPFSRNLANPPESPPSSFRSGTCSGALVSDGARALGRHAFPESVNPSESDTGFEASIHQGPDKVFDEEFQLMAQISVKTKFAYGLGQVGEQVKNQASTRSCSSISRRCSGFREHWLAPPF